MRAFLPPRCPLSEQLCVTIYISSTPSTYSNLIRRASIVSGGTSRLLEYTYTLVVQQSVQQRRIESTSSRVLCYIRIYMHAEQTKRKIGDTLGGREREKSCIEMGTCTFQAWSQTLVRIAVTSIRNSRLPPLVRPVLSPWKRSRASARNKPSPLFLASDPLPFQSSLRFATFVSFSLSMYIYMCVIVYRIFYLCST